MNLSTEQQNAVKHISGPIAVIAGPGSGKTCVLVERIAHLIASGVAPNKILAVTFTNRAADEMIRRLAERVVEQLAIPNSKNQIPNVPFIGTFHSIAHEVVRKHGAKIGLPDNWQVEKDVTFDALMAHFAALVRD